MHLRPQETTSSSPLLINATSNFTKNPPSKPQGWRNIIWSGGRLKNENNLFIILASAEGASL